MSVDSFEYSVRIGDYICLYSEDGQGFVFNGDSSIKNNGLKVYRGATGDGELHYTPNVHTVTFQVLAPNRYKLTQYYKKLRDGAHRDQTKESVLEQAKSDADEEKEDNASEQKRLLGNLVRYGDIVQLHHKFTSKFLLINTKEGSKLENNKMRVVLKDSNSKSAQFRILPRYKVKVEGEVVELEDPVVFESVKSPGNYLHTCAKDGVTEINSGTDLSVYIPYKHYSPNGTDVVRGGSIIQPFHKDMEAYLSAEGVLGGDITENAHCRIRPMDVQNIRSYYPPHNTNTFWQVVLEESAIAGSELKWDTSFHLLHMTTKRFLCFTNDGEVLLVNTTSDDTLFKLTPLYHSSKSEKVHFETTVRMVHVKTRGWVHTSKSFVYQRHDLGSTGSLEAIAWDKTELLQLRTSTGRDFPDAFILKKVGDDTVKAYNYVTGLFPFLSEITQLKNTDEIGHIPAREFSMIDHSLKELKDFTIEATTPVTDKTPGALNHISKQNMLRQTKLIDVMVNILKLPMETAGNGRMLEICKRIYEVIYSVTSSRLTANLLYCGRFLTFFQTQLLYPKGAGLQCCLTAIELIKDNRKVIDRIQPEQVNMFIDILLQHKLHHFLDLLGVLCICNDMALTENQTLIAENILNENRKDLYMLQTGHEQKTTKDKIFISTDKGHNWISLEHFVDKSSSDYNEDNYNYLLKQLNLYTKLCFGGNQRAEELVQQNQGIFNWEVALVGLQASTLPDELRTKICDLITEIYLKSVKKTSTITEVSNNYLFSGLHGASSAEDKYYLILKNTFPAFYENKHTALVDAKFPGLRVWLHHFLKVNKLDPKAPDRNAFIGRVVYLVTNLVKYEYLQDKAELHKFMNLIMGFIRERRENPSGVKQDGSTQMIKEKSIVTITPADISVLEAKIECTEFLDVIFAVQNIRRIQFLIDAYKTMSGRSDQVTLCCSNRSSLEPLMSEEITDDKLWSNQTVQRKMHKLLDEMCKKVDFLGTDIVDVLYKLSMLGSDLLRTKACSLMTRFFSSKCELLKTSMRAKLIISADSESLFHQCSRGMPDLRMVANSKMSEEELSVLTDILQSFINSFHGQSQADARRQMRQNILVNSGILDVILRLVTMEVDRELKSMAKIEETSTTLSLQLLKTLAEGNTFVQDWIFEHLNSFLYEVTSCGSHCASALIVVFKEKPHLCEKVTTKQLSQVGSLIGRNQEDAPEFVKLFKVLVEDEKTGLSHLRNQQQVIKSLMENYAKAGYPLQKTESERFQTLTGHDGKQQKVYFMNLVDVLASSAKGKNDYIQSVCQTLLSIEEVLRILSNSVIELVDKIPFAKFLERVYLNTTRTSLESGTEDLSHDRNMWDIIRMITLLPSEVSKTSDPGVNIAVTFMLEAGFHLLIGFFSRFYEADIQEHPDEQDALLNLESSLEEFCAASASFVTSIEQVDLMLECLLVLRTHIGTTPKQQKLYEKTYVKKTLEKTKKILKETELYNRKHSEGREDEFEVNHQFHTFCRNLYKYTLGKNTVAFQCQAKDKHLQKKAYIPESLATQLPQGLEFQRQVAFFAGAPGLTAQLQFQKLPWIIEQLNTSFNAYPRKAPVHQNELDITCIQIIRALLHNEISKLPDNWEDESIKWREHLTRIHKMQTALDSCDVVQKVLPLMSRSDPQVGKQVLHLLHLLLFNANRQIQESAYTYFTSTQEESFFFFIKDSIDMAIPGLKERRYLEEKKLLSNKKANQSKQNKSQKEDMTLQKTDSKVSGVDEDVDIILQVLSALCDGQNRLLQDYLRRQPDNLRSVNVISKITDFISVLYTGITPCTIGICTKLFKTLHEICEGNSENKTTLLNFKIVEYLNMLLRKTDMTSCSLKQVAIFREAIGGLLYCMVEEYGDGTSAAAQSISQTISVEHIVYVLTLGYIATMENVKVTTFKEGKSMAELAELCDQSKYDVQIGTKEIRERLVEIGFLYYSIIATIFDIDKTLADNAFTCQLEENAFQYYKNESKCIELVKDGQLQNKHFRVKDENLLREEIKEVVKWGVDRSSSTAKLTDLLTYSADIVKDITYQKRLHNNRILSMLAQKWVIWNYATILLSIVINLFMLVTWRASSTADDISTNVTEITRGDPVYDPMPQFRYVTEQQHNIVIYTLGALQVFSSVILFACYILLYHPGVPKVHSKVKEEGDSTKQSVFPFSKVSKLEIKLISKTTLYYMILVIFAVLGCVYSGYWFAFHLLGIIDNNQLLKGVIKAVTLNGRSLIWVAILGVVILYLYALISFAILRPSFSSDNLMFCETLAQCFMSVLRYGTVGDITDRLQNNDLDKTFNEFVIISFYHITFFIIFTTIGLNIIFGIIVDTFSEIRDKKWIAEKDMMEFCFICSKEKRDFEHFGKGFNHHVHQEHNMWSYVFYFLYLEETEPKDYTSLDLHVAQLIQNGGLDFFPLNQALGLTKVENEDDKQKEVATVHDINRLTRHLSKQGSLLTHLLEKVDDLERTTRPNASDPSQPSTLQPSHARLSRMISTNDERFRRLNLLSRADIEVEKDRRRSLEYLYQARSEPGTSTATGEQFSSVPEVVIETEDTISVPYRETQQDVDDVESSSTSTESETRMDYMDVGVGGDGNDGGHVSDSDDSTVSVQ